MTETIDEKDTLKTVSIEKNTWILELPPQLCAHEGFAEGTLVSLTVQDGGIEASYIARRETSRASAERFIGKYGDFMKEMEEIDS